MPDEPSTNADEQQPSSFISRVLGQAARAPGFGAIAAVFGIGVLVVTLSRFGISLVALGIGIAGTLLLAVLYLAFSWVNKLQRKHQSNLAILLAYSVVFVTTAAVFLIFSSTFFDAPLPIKTMIIQHVGGEPRINVAAILKDIEVGTTSMKYVEQRILGTPYEIFDNGIRHYKIQNGALEMLLFADSDEKNPKVQSIYLEWVRRPEPPYPIFMPPFLKGNVRTFNFGLATIDDVISNISMECSPLDGEVYQAAHYVGTGCESRIGYRDPWYYAFAITHKVDGGKLLSDIISEAGDAQSIALETIDVIVIQRNEDPMATVATGMTYIR